MVDAGGVVFELEGRPFVVCCWCGDEEQGPWGVLPDGRLACEPCLERVALAGALAGLEPTC